MVQGGIADSNALWVETPLIQSRKLTTLAGCPVYLKLENTQPTSTFKIRGLGKHLQKLSNAGYKNIVISSGGNAGVAAAYAAKRLGLNCTVFCPSTALPTVRKIMSNENAKVFVEGDVWDTADARAREVAQGPGWAYAAPYDHPDVWDGNSTLVDELIKQCSSKPSCVIASVGGGGLIIGIILGLVRNGWSDVPVIAVEAEGSCAFSESVKQNKVVTLAKINSVIGSLSPKSIASKLLELYQRGEVTIHPVTVSDKTAASATLNFADDHQALVELGCGATLSVVYSGMLAKLRSEGKITGDGPAIAIVCGGAGVQLKHMARWKKMFDL